MTAPGVLIRQAREAAGMTQYELAKKCHSAQSAISRLESGRVSPTVETLERILRAAGAELDLTTHPRRRRRSAPHDAGGVRG